MQLNANSISKIEATKTAFEKAFKENLVNDCFRNVVVASIPLKDGEREKIDNPEFKDKLTAVLSSVSRELVNGFDHVGQFDTGNLFTSMVNSVAESVSLESAYRQQRLINQIRLGKIEQDEVSLNKACESAFANSRAFESPDVEKRFVQDMKYIMSVEDANDVVERIKNDVRDAIEETEAKNELVEGTTQELIDYKNEIAPPDDEYQDPTQTETNPADDLNSASEDPDNMLADTSDDGLAGDSTTDSSGEEEPLYEDEVGGEATTSGDPTQDATATSAEQPGSDPTATEDPTTDTGAEPQTDPTADMGGETSTDTEMGTDTDTGTETPDDTGDDLATDDSGLGGDMGTDDGTGLDAGGTDMGGDPTADDSTTMDAGADPAADGGGAGNTNNNSGGITININGAGLSAKESLNLYNARSLAEKRVPLGLRTFESMSLPSVDDLAAECVNAVGDVRAEMGYRLDGLKLAAKQAHGLSVESSAAINEKIGEYGKTIANALNDSSFYTKKLNEIGLTSQGLIRATENTFAIARNIINRFIYKRQGVARNVRPYTSKENVFANAFDIVQMRQYLDRQKNPKTEMIDDLESRENVFYHNMVNYDDDNVKKEATAIIDLSRLNFKKAISPNFITDYKIKVWEENIGDKSNIEINSEVCKRVEDNFKKLWGRDLNDAEKQIIKATTQQDDVTEIVPTPYEKFLITMSKEAILAHGAEDPIKGAGLTKTEKKDIEWKSRLMTTVYKAAESFGLFNESDNVNFQKFVNMVGM